MGAKTKNITLRHDYIKSQLEGAEGQTFLTDFLCLSKRKKTKTANYIVRHEIPINGRRNRLDTVFLLKYPMANGLQTIGIEIKGHRHDLLKDMKMYTYLGHTDYFFLAVPPVLVKPARIKAAIDPRLGLIRMSDGKIIIFPEKQEVPIEFKDEVISNTLTNTNSSACGTICVGP